MARPSTYATAAAEVAFIAVEAYAAGADTALSAKTYRECEPKDAVNETNANTDAHATTTHQLMANVPATIVATIAM